MDVISSKVCPHTGVMTYSVVDLIATLSKRIECHCSECRCAKCRGAIKDEKMTKMSPYQTNFTRNVLSILFKRNVLSILLS
jgi:hypothetical protein